MPLTAAKTCRCQTPCGCNETEICPPVVEVKDPCTPQVQPAECDKMRIPFGDEYDPSRGEWPAGSLVNSEWGLYYTPCVTHSPLGKKPWSKFHADIFFKLYGLIVQGACGLDIRGIGCPDFCNGVKSVPVFDVGQIGCQDGKLWVSNQPANASLPPNDTWDGGKSMNTLLVQLLTS